MNNNKLRTQPIKGLCIFLLIAILLSLGVMIYFIIAFNEELLIFKILIFIFCPMFIILGAIALCDQLFHYVEIEGEKVINHVMWNKHTLKISHIDKIEICDGIYTIYGKGRKFATFPSQIKGSNEIIICLERHGKMAIPVEGKRRRF